MKKVIVWFRKDLRIHDNEALIKAIENADEIYPVYIFDDEECKGTSYHQLRYTGPHRLGFIIESVVALRKTFNDLGIDLIVRSGNPVTELSKLAETINASSIYANMERHHEALRIQNALEKNLWRLGKEIYFYRGKMLYYTQDLPFPIKHTPDSFKQFRKEVEKIVQVRKPLKAPKSLKSWSKNPIIGEVPKLSEFNCNLDFIKDQPVNHQITGGEKAALDRMRLFLSKKGAVDSYNKKNTLTDHTVSSKLSAYLSLGCLSPKLLYHELKKYQHNYGHLKATEDFQLNLLLRDYKRLMAKKYMENLFKLSGMSGQVKHSPREQKFDTKIFKTWIEGETDSDFINAIMVQLKKTGYIPFRCRQITASYLVNELKISWHMGASYFQYALIDYDVCSNWVNWNIIGGHGPNQKEEFSLNIPAQAKALDPKGKYTYEWLNRAPLNLNNQL